MQVPDVDERDVEPGEQLELSRDGDEGRRELPVEEGGVTNVVPPHARNGVHCALPVVEQWDVEHRVRSIQPVRVADTE